MNNGTLDKLAALRLASRLTRTRSLELQRIGQFTDAESYLEAHVALEGLRFDLDAGMEELEATGGNEIGGMKWSLADDDEGGG